MFFNLFGQHKRILILLVAFVFSWPAPAQQDEIDPVSGLVISEGWEMVHAHCSGCHSTKLVIQNRMTEENWLRTIRSMQAKHGLWDLGDAEPVIVAYLGRYYGIPELAQRRQPLDTTWLEPIEEN